MKQYSTGNRISKVEATDETLSGRGGLALFVRYLEGVGIYDILMERFGFLRKSGKGLAIWNLFKQAFCFFLDGTSRHLTYFDQLKEDAGYAATIENDVDSMASSHAVKRFFKSFPLLCSNLFRPILRTLFIWRLQIEQPEVIELTIDTMVMDNDEALKREGVDPTYKKVKGFQPLQVIWKGKIIDALFRGGKKHGNHGDTVVNMITGLVKLIRGRYREDVAIIVRMDSGFFDDFNFCSFDDLGIGFIATGKMYTGVKEQVSGAEESFWGRYDNGHQKWSFLEFGYRCDTWDRFWRAIYTRPFYEGRQMLFDFARPDNVILTNLGVNPEALKHLSAKERERLLSTEAIVQSHHQRGADELPHRGLKDLGFEQLPFKRFAANSAFYYCMLISFFLFETFKEDVLEDVVPITSYATTVRRRVVDIAAKIIRTGGQLVLKVPRALMDALSFELLWARCQEPPPIPAFS